jgi:hypothetical protein
VIVGPKCCNGLIKSDSRDIRAYRTDANFFVKYGENYPFVAEVAYVLAVVHHFLHCFDHGVSDIIKDDAYGFPIAR